MRRVFIDMDGVLCEFKADAQMSDLERDGYFRELEPRKNMLDAVKYLIKKECAEVFVLSSVLPQKEIAAIHEKNDWLNEHLPEIDHDHRLFPLCGTDKADAVDRFGTSDILLDDYSYNLDRWVSRGGKGVKIINEINGITGKYRNGPRLNVQRPEELYLAVSVM